MMIGIATVLVACASAPRTEIGSGRYSGSTSKDAAITIDVGGSQIRVNSRRAKLVRVDDNRKFIAIRMAGKPEFFCNPQARGKELRCEVRWPDHTEVMELMKE